MTKERLDIPEVEGDEPIIAYRLFVVHEQVGGVRLYGLRSRDARSLWSGPERYAVCENTLLTLPDCEASEFSHGSHPCGLYSTKIPDDFELSRQLPCVIAEVANSGYVVEHERGYRAERVRIRRMWLLGTKAHNPLHFTRSLARHYGVPCTPVGSIWDVHRELGTYETAVGIAQVKATEEMFRRARERDMSTLIAAGLLGRSTSWTSANPYGVTSSGNPLLSPSVSLSQSFPLSQSLLSSVLSQVEADLQQERSRWDRLMDWWTDFPIWIAVPVALITFTAIWAAFVAVFVGIGALFS